MYSFNSSYVLSNQFNSDFTETDISQEKLSFILYNYVKAYVVINYSYSTDLLYFDLFEQVDQNTNLDITVNDLIATFLDGTKFKLASSANLNSLKVTKTKYIDSALAGYGLKKLGNDIGLTRSNTSYADLIKSTLFTVNGFLHQTYLNVDSLGIKNGYLSAQKNSTLGVGLLNFSEIGADILTVPITSNNIIFDDPSNPLGIVYLNMYSSDTPSTYFMSIGGYLISIDGIVLTNVGGGNYKLNLQNFDYFNKIAESGLYLQNEFFTKYQSATGVIDKNQISTTGAVIDFLTSSNSFLIIVPKENMVIKKRYISNDLLKFSFVDFIKPDQPLFLGKGRMLDYYYVNDDFRYLISSQNLVAFQRTYYTSPNSNFIDYKNLPFKQTGKNSLVFKQFCFF